MKYVLPTVAGCASAALVGTLLVSAPTASAAATSPDVSKEALNVSKEGLNVPGARDSSDPNATAANQSATSNLPNIFKSQTALASAKVPDIVNASASATTGSVNNDSAGLTSGTDEAAPSQGSAPSGTEQAPAEDAENEAPKSEDEKSDEAGDEGAKDSAEESKTQDEDDISGSVRQKTEDGVNIALISDVLDVPDDHPSLIGFTFSESKSNIRIQVRTKQGSEWGNWNSLDEEEQEEAQNKGSEPMTVSNASAVQMRILGDSAPSEAELVLVDSKQGPGDAQAVAENDPVELDNQASGDSADAESAPEQSTEDSTGAEAASAENVDAAAGATVTNQNYVPGSSTVDTVAKKVSKPKIGSRSSWGAKAYNGSPDYASGIKQAVVHHTSGSNSYSAADVPGIIRGIQAYHQQGRGWDDIGYNVVADKYGRLWQARGGDIEKAVIGAHVAGHNTGTFGISVLGTYNSAAPPKKTRDAVSSAIAWKFSINGISKATSSNMVGHRDLGQTDCPGDAFYAKLGEMRSTVNSILKTGEQPSDSKDDSKKDDSKKDDDKKTEKPKSKTSIEKYAEKHKLGKALGKEHDVKGISGAKAQKFEKGTVYWSKKTGAYHLSGAIASAYKGNAVTDLGLPTSAEKGGLKDGGAAQRFEKGSFYWSKATGAHYTSGNIMKYWGDKGTVKGHLGYPKSDVAYKNGRGEQLFQGARLVWAEGYGTTEFSPKGSIAGGVSDDNAPGGTTPPGDDSTDDKSPADSGEGSADDKDSKDDKSKDASDDKDSKDDKSKDDSKKDDSKKDDKKKDEPSKAEKIAAQRASIIKDAKANLGVKYVWGGTSPKSGWDCSGYTQYVYGKNGIKLPRTTSQQRYAGKEISLKDAKAGDLIWIPGHIGIISETKGQMYDAGSTRTNTTKRSYSWMLDRGAKVIRVVG
ncbi:LGFP repeat-containing protein [Brevibacterium siliguriense]|uniref:LGFP repeat-containing protein n=1 Tax=Brevibacterium siliguriense TaxID=1136497 RepID=A0A1H1VVY6_9MICO|nr:NlpC/P60 family protein [Brevibacterium siliguriense]SDS88903.1 LGFP repeat-containing protein [Brevibacterium siliguriense]